MQRRKSDIRCEWVPPGSPGVSGDGGVLQPPSPAVAFGAFGAKKTPKWVTVAAILAFFYFSSSRIPAFPANHRFRGRDRTS